MEAISSKTSSPIRSFSLYPGFARRSSIGVCACVVSLLFAIAQLTGCGVTYNTIPLTVNPSSLSFGAVAVGATQAATVSVQNQGLSAVTLDGIQAADPAFQLAPVSMPATIPAGGTASLKVTFAPTAVKSYSSQIMIKSAGGQTALSVSGTGQHNNRQPPPTSPALQVSTTSLQFGSVPIGGDAQQSLTLTSTGTAPLQINALNATGGSFSAKAPALPLTLQPGQTLMLPVMFGPRNSGMQTGQLVIASDAAAAPSVTVNLTGSGAAQTPPPPTSSTPALTLSTTAVNFGSVTVGAQGASSVTLTSSGTAAVILQSLTVSGNTFSAGKVPLPLTLAPGQQVVLPLTFTPSAAGSQQGQIALADNATGSPNTISLMGTGAAAPQTVSLSAPSSVEFGGVTVGSQGSKTITLVSTGTSAVTVKSISMAGAAFSDSAVVLPQVLQPNQQMSVKLKFNPAAEGDASGTVTVSSDAKSGPIKVHVHGSGVAASTPSLSASASSLSFGQVPMGTPATKTVTVTSTGTAPATIMAGSVTGAAYAATYAGVPVGNIAAPITLQPGQQVTFSVVFDPASVGALSGQLSLSTDTGAPVNVALTGQGQQAPSPALTVSAPSLNFGDVQVGAKGALQLTLTSSGTAPVTISSPTIAGQQFQISSVTYPAGITQWPATLNPGQQVVLSITFAPDSADSFSGDLSLASNASGGTANVPLSGTGEAVPTPNLTLSASSINFGQSPVGSKVTRTLTLTSTGNAPLDVNTITVAGVSFGTGTLSLPATLQPNQQMTVTVTFDPTTEGPESGTLTVASSDPSGPAAVSLGGNGTAITAPQLTVSPTAVNFGNTQVNVPSTQTVTLTSTGTAPVTISAAAASGAGFSVSGATFPLTLNPNQTATLQVQFDPSAAGPAAGQLTVTSDSTTGATTLVSLSGNGAVATSPQLTVSTNSLSFGNVSVNNSATLPLTLTSSGTAPLTISAATLSGTDFTDSGATLPVTLNPNQSVTLNVRFNPAAAGQASGQLTISSNSSSGGTTVVQLSGTGTVATSPQLTVSANSLSFGNVSVNNSATLPLTLTSSGTAPLTISAATLSGTDFTDSGATLPVTLNPNQSVTLNVRFNPGAAGQASGQLTISSNSSSGGTTVVQLSGTGTVATSPQLTVSANSLSFGNVSVNNSATLPLTLTSSGTAPLTISAATLSGTDFTDSGATLPVTLNPNQSVTLNVRFNPGAAGQASGQLTITSNSSSGASTVVQLSGTGTVATSPQLTVSANSLSFGNVAVNSTATLPLTFTSSGTAPLTINAATLNGADFSDSGTTFPVTLNPNQSVTLNVLFDPAAAGQTTGQLTISSNSSSGATTVVQLSGTGTVVATPQLLVSATSLSFGNVPVDSTGTLSLTLTSSGTAPLTVSSVALQGTGYSDSGATFPVTLNPNQSVTLSVQFDPTAAGAASGKLTITSNSTTGGTTQVSLSGTGTAVQHEIDLSWNAPSSSTDPVNGYNVYRSTNGGGSFTKLNASPDSQVTYTDNAVQSGSTYVYEVKSVDASGVESSASNQITLTVP